MHLAAYHLALALLAASSPFCAAASAWGFEDATVSVHGKKSSAGVGLKEKYVAQPLIDTRALILI